MFDLNELLCDQVTPENFGSRILILEAPGASTHYVGLLASGMTDTIEAGAPAASGEEEAKLFDVDAYLPMLCNLIPPVPDRTEAHA